MDQNNNMILRAVNGKNGLDFYLRTSSGQEHYLVTFKPNGLLWQKLRSGVTLGELRRLKPRSARTEQKYFNSTRHLLKVADSFIEYDLAG